MNTGDRLPRLLPWACLAAGICLFASQLMTMFEFTPPGAEPLAERSVIDHHGPALAVIAVFAVIAMLVAVWGASKPAAVAVAVMGGLAMLIFLLIDLPDAGQVGTLDDARGSFIDAEAVPQGGFWLEMVGALGLAISGIALATLTPEQLAALRPQRDLDAEEATAPSANPGTSADDQAEAERRRLHARPRARQRR